ncbi:hypothetical protein ABE504_09675 [Paenibacillus oryzisoli]|uniref:hypothetical protein n=1 Tax=Paenibacillus oryzisoli TaxID=1850517 RepID=UPI003D29CBF9
MEQQITTVIAHIAASHRELAALLASHRHISSRMAALVGDLPDSHPEFQGLGVLHKRSLQLTKNVTSYVSSLAELAEEVAKRTEIIMKEMQESHEE